ncbi:hypothetical protein V2J09_011864 [Rumex salicifolius]
MMATYFNGGSEIQADNLQTLYLMNRGGGGGGGGVYAAYSDSVQASSGVLLSAAASSQQPNVLPQGSIHHAPNLFSHHHQHQHHLIGIPLAGNSSPAGDDHGQLVPRFHYNLWGGVTVDPSPSDGGGHNSHIPTAIAVTSGGELASPMGCFRHPSQGGLSLSLNNSSPHKTAAAAGTVTSVVSPGSGTPTSASGVTSLIAGGGAPTFIMGSKYLKPAQQLLDETVNVGKAIHMADASKDKAKATVDDGGESGSGKVGGVTAAADLTTAQRQELQMKKAKLLNMLDEVEQRYRQYHSQMQALAAAFEQAAGPGSARSYTALALQTISRQFRCLKDAIGAQVKAAGRGLGEEMNEEEEGREGSGVTRSRLRMVDNQLRQQRALQQLGMMHHNAWRPQRGLPERAVSVLRAWLFEHFLHPYPKDSDKHMLAKQTGLTRSQVSNWFINARVRLWKPMVEEMYLEETKYQQQQQNPSDSDVHPTTAAAAATPKSPPPSTLHFNQQNPHPVLNPTVNDLSSNTSLLSPNNSSSMGHGPLTGFTLIGSSETDHKRQRVPPSDVIHNLNSSSPSSILASSMDHHNNNKEIKDFGGFGPYPIPDIGSRFNPDHHLAHHHQQYHHGNTVALTLGLPHCDQNLTLAGTHHQNFQAELCGIDTSQPPPPPHSSGAYDGGGITDVHQSRTSWRSTLI